MMNKYVGEFIYVGENFELYNKKLECYYSDSFYYECYLNDKIYYLDKINLIDVDVYRLSQLNDLLEKD